MLHAGVTALEAGATASAARIFAALGRAHPLVADHAARFEVEALLRDGQAEEAATLAARALAAGPRPHVARTLARLAAEAEATRGNEAAARAALERAAKGETDSERLAELREAQAESHAREGDAAAAAARWLEIWSRYPTSEPGKRADARLDALGAGAASGRSALSRLRTRCEKLVSAYANEPALETCTAAWKQETHAGRKRALERRRARVLFRLRRYPEAEVAYRGLGDDRDARFWAARAMARAGDVPTSITRFEKLGKGSDALAARSRFLAATLLEDRDPARADALYESVASRAPQADQRREAGWRLGWSDYRAGRFEAAVARFDRLARGEPDPIEALRGRYWAARSRERAEPGSAAAAEALRALAADSPYTYYGWRASGRAGTAGAPPAQEPHGPPRPSALPQDVLARARILVEGGLPEEAALELDTVRRRARGRSDRLVLAGLYQAAGEFHRAQRVVLDAYLGELAKGPGTGSPELWWMAWPNAFEPEVERAVHGRRVPPELVYAVMREESGYRPKVVSVVGARGLGQIMPSTGRVLAARLGAGPFDPDELFEPARNLQLSALYLEELLHRFAGRESAAIASYNAGPEAVARWLARDGDLDDDEWVEAIPYDQTRGYVKRVLRSMHAYRRLY